MKPVYSAHRREPQSIFNGYLDLERAVELFAGARADQFDFSVNSGATAYTGATNGAKTYDESMGTATWAWCTSPRTTAIFIT